ncbi:MAG: M20/M25/M40 family metallo-hydrolase [Deltaproteobacteria bacterium]|nr:M20/M25/M40 family metallo-hydrolase [Deltaproteobacteria bacterium]
MSLENYKSLYHKHCKSIQKSYFHFLSFKSISSEPEYKGECLKCASWLEKYLHEAGFSVEVIPTSGNPLLLANYHLDRTKPTVMFYGHYDVQPVDPIELWQTDPFNATIVDNNVYARGAQDDKGQIFSVLSALKQIKEIDGGFPLNVKLCIEGDEEHGSQGLSEIIKQQRDKLIADYLVIVDVGWDAPDEPSITMGVRGIACMSVELSGSKTDLHSGLFGGLAYNPNRAMVELLSKLHHENGKVCVPGFYDKVQLPGEQELKLLNQDIHQKDMENDLGITIAGGEKEFSPYYWRCLRPTLEINGLGGGYSGNGFKTVIPAKAIAKLSVRLVPDQDPNEIVELIEKFLRAQAHPAMKLTFTLHPGVGKALRTSPTSLIAKAAAQAISDVNSKPCAYILDGASIPITTELAQAACAETVLIGYGLPGDQIHAPNEHFGLDRFEKSFLTTCRLIELLGA